jgi:beta-galactosidase
VTALAARDGLVSVVPQSQLLIYPCLDLTARQPSHDELASGYLLTRQLYAWYRSNYIGEFPDPADRAGFEDSVKQQLAEMIRINRNHSSIVSWGMDNEVFFSDKTVMPDVLLLLLLRVSHRLDPSRPAAVDGAQRGDIDHLGDIAGYNGDGAWMYLNPGIASFVAEYGSTMEDRPGSYAPG